MAELNKSVVKSCFKVMRLSSEWTYSHRRVQACGLVDEKARFALFSYGPCNNVIVCALVVSEVQNIYTFYAELTENVSKTFIGNCWLDRNDYVVAKTSMIVSVIENVTRHKHRHRDMHCATATEVSLTSLFWQLQQWRLYNVVSVRWHLLFAAVSGCQKVRGLTLHEECQIEQWQLWSE